MDKPAISFVPLHQARLRSDGHSDDARVLAREIALRWGLRRPGDRSSFDWGALPDAAQRGGAFSVSTARGTLTVMRGVDTGLWLMRRDVRDLKVEGRVWRHEVFVSGDDLSDIVGVRTSVAFGKNTVAPDAAPSVVSALVRNCLLRDGPARISSRARRVEFEDAGAMQQLVGSTERQLPVLTFSCRADEGTPFDVNALAQRLAGFAHVLVASPDVTRIAGQVIGVGFGHLVSPATLFWPCSASWSGASHENWAAPAVRAEGFLAELERRVLRASCDTTGNWFGTLTDRAVD